MRLWSAALFCIGVTNASCAVYSLLTHRPFGAVVMPLAVAILVFHLLLIHGR